MREPLFQKGFSQTVEKAALPRRVNKKQVIKYVLVHFIIAGDTSNITCYLSLFVASSPTVPLYAYRLEATEYHRLFESLSDCRESRATATKNKSK